MKFVCFHLMPYRPLDLEAAKKYRSAWVVLPNSFYDPKKGAAEYDSFIDQLVYAEALGFDGLWTAETRHDPFLPLALAAEHTRRPVLGTDIAVAFPRSPTVVAHAAWDLQAASGGRFVLGLGTQVKGHIERRFGVPWTAPGPRLRDYVLALEDVLSHGAT